jgi:hypothetical protein
LLRVTLADVEHPGRAQSHLSRGGILGLSSLA